MSRHRPSTDDREHHESRSRAVRGCARLADSGPFNSAIFGVIIANAVVLGLETYPEIDREHGGTLAALNDVCLGIFVVELLIRLIAVGGHPREFLRSGWNVFDVVVIAGAFLPGLRENVTLLRLVRLARIVRVVRLLPDLRVLVLAVGRSLPGIASLMIMGAIAVYVYGMVGWVLFGDALPGEFGTIGDAMLTMFVALPGENIPDLLDRGVDASRWAAPYSSRTCSWRGSSCSTSSSASSSTRWRRRVRSGPRASAPSEERRRATAPGPANGSPRCAPRSTTSSASWPRARSAVLNAPSRRCRPCRALRR